MFASSASNCKASMVRAGRSDLSRVAAAAATSGSTDAKSVTRAKKVAFALRCAAADADKRLVAATGTELELEQAPIAATRRT